jgi:hypothetical protein
VFTHTHRHTSRRRLSSTPLAVIAALAMAAPLAVAAGPSVVVPGSGSIAGHGYAYWLV